MNKLAEVRAGNVYLQTAMLKKHFHLFQQSTTRLVENNSNEHFYFCFDKK